MGQKVLILGGSGTGKSASLRNFKTDEIFVINSAGKPLPFKNHFEAVTPSFNRLTQDVMKALDSTDKKVIVVDDAQYIMSFQYMRRIKENGWDKWNDIQGDFFNIIQHVDDLPDDVVVYFLSHIQRDDDGHEKIKTMGKLLDEKITIEGLFTTVLKTLVKDGQYFFLTQNSGLDTVKSPIGMFPSYAIDNDLKYVDTKIRNYYEIGDYADDETVEKMDQEAKAEDVEKPAAEGRTRRTRKSANAETNNTDSKGNAGTESDKGTSTVGSDSGSGARSDAVVATDDEQPKRRSRKVRNEKEEDIKEKQAETQVEDAKEERTFEAAVNEPKRRRRRANKLTAEDIAKADGFVINDEDLPF
jgi:hypothetical protein